MKNVQQHRHGVHIAASDSYGMSPKTLPPIDSHLSHETMKNLGPIAPAVQGLLAILHTQKGA